MNHSDHLNSVIDIVDSIKPYRITVLTGSNGSGKSLVRKIIGGRIGEKVGKKQPVVAQMSMELRTGGSMDGGAMNAFIRDTSWNPTGLETINKLEGLCKQKNRYLVLDEPELGMGEELIAAMVIFLNETLPQLKEIFGVLIITHSRSIVQNLTIDFDFYNIEGMNKDQWLNRVIIPQDIKKLSEDSHKLFLAIERRMKENKEKKDKTKN